MRYRLKSLGGLCDVLLDGGRTLHGDLLHSVLVDDFSRHTVHNDQAGYASDLELLGEDRETGVLEGKRVPRLLSVVLIVEVLGLVTRAEDHGEVCVAAVVHLLVELSENGRELPARRAGMHTEVDADDLRLAESLLGGDLAAGLARDAICAEKFLNHLSRTRILKYYSFLSSRGSSAGCTGGSGLSGSTAHSSRSSIPT